MSKRLDELSYDEFWDYFKSLVGEDFNVYNPNNVTEYTDDIDELDITTLDDYRENEYWIMVLKISRTDNENDFIVLSWTGYYDSWNGTEWDDRPCKVTEKSEMRLITWYEDIGWV